MPRSFSIFHLPSAIQDAFFSIQTALPAPARSESGEVSGHTAGGSNEGSSKGLTPLSARPASYDVVAAGSPWGCGAGLLIAGVECTPPRLTP
jgi:hypothetical protein